MLSGIRNLLKIILGPREQRYGRIQNGDEARARLQKIFLEENVQGIPSDTIERKMQSMKDSQGVSDFSGSSYNGPGNITRETRNSNMSQRNF